jgi:hypothetical protein
LNAIQALSQLSYGPKFYTVGTISTRLSATGAALTRNLLKQGSQTQDLILRKTPEDRTRQLAGGRLIWHFRTAIQTFEDVVRTAKVRDIFDEVVIIIVIVITQDFQSGIIWNFIIIIGGQSGITIRYR